MIARMATTPITFFGEVRDELKKVVWPSRQETIRLTVVILTVSLLVGAFLGGLDFAFTKLLQVVVK
jgi:preprotein translocase subunit SecE